MSTSQHTCATGGRLNCQPCMQFETDLWDAINRYAISVGGDPGKHVYVNVSRMQAVADVGAIVGKVSSRQQIDDIVVGELVKGSNAAAAAACDRGAEVIRLRAALSNVRGFLREIARRSDAENVLDEVDRLDRVLAETKEVR